MCRCPAVSKINSYSGPFVSTVQHNVPRDALGDSYSAINSVGVLGPPAIRNANLGPFTRLAYERLIADELALWLDPNANRRFRQIEKRARREFDQKFFSKPGKGLPQRLPDLSAAGG